jgi:ribosome-associated protein
VARPTENRYLPDDQPGRAGPNAKDIPLSKTALTRAKRKKPASVSKPDSETDARAAKETLRITLASLDDMKAEDIVTIDLAGKTSIGDYMVVASGRSQRHVASIAEDLIRNLKKAGLKNLRSEGRQAADWMLIDAGDVIVHVFQPEIRAFYDLEKMWSGRGGPAKRPD